MKKLRLFDTFAGIGMMSLGMEQTGCIETVAFCEIKKSCQNILAKHWPGKKCYLDISKLKGGDIEEEFDILAGGFPCQDISVAGKRKGIRAKRSGMFWSLLRVIKQKRPRWLLLENVPNLRTNGADEVLAALEKTGYTCWTFVVGAWAIGASHNRNRVWILGYTEHHGQADVAIARSAKKSFQDDKKKSKSAVEPARAGSSRTVSRNTLLENAKGKRFSQPLFKRLLLEGGARTTHQRHGSAVRGVTFLFPAFRGQKAYKWEHPRVKRRLGRTDDGYTKRMDRIEMLGNSVVPGLVYIFAKLILKLERDFC